MNLISGYIYLIIAIILGISSNSFLKATNSFTNIVPTIFCIITIISCIFCLSKSMNTIPVGFAYATYGAFIIIGVILLNTLGKTN